MSFRLSALALATLLTAPQATFAQEGVAARVTVGAATCPATSPGPGLYVVAFENGKWVVKPPTDARITTKTVVRVSVHGLNHFRYALETDVKEEVSEAYQYLEKLWGSVFGGGLLQLTTLDAATARGATPTKEEQLRDALHKVYKAGLALDRAVATAVKPFKAVGVSQDDCNTLITTRKDVEARLTAAIDAANELQALIEKESEVFFLAQANYATIVKVVDDGLKAATSKAGTFLAMATLVIEGEERAIGTKKAGTRVTVNLHAAAGAGVKTWIADLSYIVQSERPLVAHAGMSFGSLNEISFEKVRRVNGLSADDLFVQEDTGTTTSDFLLFLGYQLGAINPSRLGESRDPDWAFFASLGTAIREPGKKIFLGPSVAFKRFVLTGGAVIGKEAEGVEQVQSDNLFKAIREQTKTGGFIAFSVRVF
jgi:hypothetical protein